MSAAVLPTDSTRNAPRAQQFPHRPTQKICPLGRLDGPVQTLPNVGFAGPDEAGFAEPG